MWLAPCAHSQTPSSATSAAATSVPSFPPLNRWRAAIEAADPERLARMYMRTPPPELEKAGVKATDPKEEAVFWSSFGRSAMKSALVEDVQLSSPRADLTQVAFEMVLTLEDIPKPGKVYVGVRQLWMKSGEEWKILATKHTQAGRLKQPMTRGNLYPAEKDADAEIQAALERASGAKKRVLVVFGANWCYDCYVLDAALHDEEIAPLVNANFEVVHVDIGEGNKNLHLMQRYAVPLEKGIPAVAVLESDGKLLFSQKNGEFEKMRSLAPEDVLDFLHRWKPKPGPT